MTAAAVFLDPQRLDARDTRKNYGEERRVTIGRALGIVLTLVCTQRGSVTWPITVWPANRKERLRYDGH
jgi:uncharacterized DUF497 family protein